MKTVRNKIKETVVVVLLGGLISVVPFYFETKAMTEENRRLNTDQDVEIVLLKEETGQLKLNQVVGQAEIEHNKEILLRIEKKLDELRQEVKALD